MQRYDRRSHFERDHSQPKSRLGTMEERCINCRHEFGEHYNGQCPLDDDDGSAEPASGASGVVRTRA